MAASHSSDLAPGSHDPALALALAYAPRDARPVFQDLFALDRRLADAVRQASEPIIAQLKLAWWRDRFAQSPAEWPKGEPLLARLAGWDADISRLGGLVDGWEQIAAAEELTRDVAIAFAGRRARSWAVAASALHVAEAEVVDAAGMRWALADLAQHCASEAESALVRAVAADLGHASAESRGLPRNLRPFAILGVLGGRALLRERPMLSTGGDFLAAVRTGMLGR